MKVRANSLYHFKASTLDTLYPVSEVDNGDIVRVVNVPGCPAANTMGNCHIANPITGKLLGLVSTASLTPASADAEAVISRAIEFSLEHDLMTYPTGTQYLSNGKHPRVCTITDVWTTTDSQGKVVKVQYVSTHNFFGRIVTEYYVCAVTIAKGIAAMFASASTT